MLDIETLFERHSHESSNFDKIRNKLHSRPDMCAFLILDKLMQSNKKMISSVCYEGYYLNVDCEELAKVATEEDIVNLIRCGVIYDEETEDLIVFV